MLVDPHRPDGEPPARLAVRNVVPHEELGVFAGVGVRQRNPPSRLRVLAGVEHRVDVAFARRIEV